MMIMFKE